MSKVRLILLFCLSCLTLVALGQKKKQPAVLVFGNDILAFSAAVQSARSDVPTLWLLSSKEILPQWGTEALAISNYPNLDGGIWMEILMEMVSSTQKSDSLAAMVKQDLNPGLLRNALEKIAAKEKNLTLVFNQSVKQLKRNRKTWSLRLANNSKYEVRSIFDASSDQGLQQFVGSHNQQARPAKIAPIAQLNNEQLKTLVACGQSGSGIYGVYFSSLMFLQNNNLLTTFGTQQLFDDMPSTIPLQAQVGQAYGALAAYLAFFKTDVEKVDMRKLQTELLVHGARIMPYQDIQIEDPNFLAIQKIGLSNLLKGKMMDNYFMFDVEAPVHFDEVEAEFKQLYYRSQLWFLDHKGTVFTWKEYLSLLKFVGLRGDEIEQQLKNDWSHKLKFQGDFRPEGVVTRYQFATLLDRYASPFIKTVSQEGQLIN